MGFAYDGFPEDFLERYRDRVEAVSLEDVRAVAGRFLHPDAMSMVVVGEDAALAGIGGVRPGHPHHPATVLSTPPTVHAAPIAVIAPAMPISGGSRA